MARTSTKDQIQTARCEQVRTRLQSIAIQAVEAQDCIGADRCTDLLDDIERDLAECLKQQRLLVGAW